MSRKSALVGQGEGVDRGVGGYLRSAAEGQEKLYIKKFQCEPIRNNRFRFVSVSVNLRTVLALSLSLSLALSLSRSVSVSVSLSSSFSLPISVSR